MQYIDDDLKTVQSDKLLDKHGFYVLSKLFTQVNRRNKLYESDFLMKIFSRLIPINAGQNWTKLIFLANLECIFYGHFNIDF